MKVQRKLIENRYKLAIETFIKEEILEVLFSNLTLKQHNLWIKLTVVIIMIVIKLLMIIQVL